jgi:DNA-binding transcriptional ArsR family regulator
LLCALTRFFVKNPKILSRPLLATMNSGIAALHKILKDETRRQILLLLSEKGSVTYTELMGTLGIVSTGTLNYHLKVLGDLVSKNESGQYSLTERGNLASRLLAEYSEKDDVLQTKKKWWNRFWVVAILLQVAALIIVFALYFLRLADSERLITGFTSFAFGLIFLYFFYRMIRPPTETKSQKNQTRTIEDIFVSGRSLEEVREEITGWIKDEGITIEMDTEEFVRGRLGIPSGLGLTAPKYFEVSLKPNQSGVMVHTEGWISLYDVSERSFSNRILVSGNIPRRKGWKVMEHLWERLRAMSKQVPL